MCSFKKCLDIIYETCNCCNLGWCQKHIDDHLESQARN